MDWQNLGYREIAQAIDTLPVLAQDWHYIPVSYYDVTGPWVRQSYKDNKPLGAVYESSYGDFLWEVNSYNTIPDKICKGGRTKTIVEAKKLVDETLVSFGVLLPSDK